MNLKKTNIYSIAIVGITMLLSACGGSKESKVTELTGAGATFPYPYYSKLFDVYNNEKGIKVNYQSIGSGGGIKQLQTKTVDFGASDAPMSDDELSKSAAIVHIPTCLGAVVVTYNIPGDPILKLTPEVVADIFLGKITRWNDAALKKLNPEINLPELGIYVIHRSDGSGTTYIFSDYLSKVSSDFKTKPGKGKSLDWPVGLGAKGNEGVSGLVKQTPGSIGYVELNYAITNKMAAAKLKNKSGTFVEASISTTTAAANVTLPADLRVSLTNTDAKDGYPICSFTYLLVYKEQKYDTRTEATAKSTIELIWWVIHQGQQYANALNYAPLPDPAVKAAESNLKAVMYDNNPIMK